MPNRNGRGESSFRGVARSPSTKKWRAQIQLHLGNYDTEAEAAEIYHRAELLFRRQALDLRTVMGDLRDNLMQNQATISEMDR